MCRTRACCVPSAGLSRSHGLSVRYFIAMAHSITALRRWRTHRAVSGCPRWQTMVTVGRIS